MEDNVSTDAKKKDTNLSTIKEEVDLSDRIRSLKGKHIKIKKIVKKDDGNYSIREASLFSDKSMDQNVQQIGGSGESALRDVHVPTNYQPYSVQNILPLDFHSIKHITQTSEGNVPPTSELMKKSVDVKAGKTSMTTADVNLNFTMRRDSLNIAGGLYHNQGASYLKTSAMEIMKEPSLARLDSYSSGYVTGYNRRGRNEFNSASSYEYDNDNLMGSFIKRKSRILDENNLSSSGLSNKRPRPLNFEHTRTINEPIYGNRGKKPLKGDIHSVPKRINESISPEKNLSSIYQSNYIEENGRFKPGLTHSSSLLISSDRLASSSNISIDNIKMRQSGMLPTNIMKTSNYNDMPLSQYYDTILNRRANERSKEYGSMGRSQSMSRSGLYGQPSGYSGTPQRQGDIGKDITEFALPKEIVKFLEEEPGKLAELKKKVEREKESIDAILDGVMKEVGRVVQAKKLALHCIFDDFLKSYEESKEVLRKKVEDFKDSNRGLGFGDLGGSRDRLVMLETIEFYTAHGKAREEACKLKCRLGTLTREVEKKYLQYYVENLERELDGFPSLSRTETADQYLKEMVSTAVEKVESSLEIVDGLVYKTEGCDFGGLSVRPVVRPSLGESKSNLIANICNPMLKTSPFKVEVVQMGYTQKISCLCVVEEDLVATGHTDGTIAIWSMGRGVQAGTLTGHGEAVSSLVSIKAYYQEIAGEGREGRGGAGGFLRNKQVKQQNFLISGTEGQGSGELFVWDLQSMRLVRKLAGHVGTITSIISLRDGHSVVSGGLDGSVRAWDIATLEAVQTTGEGEKAQVYYIHVFNDYSHFVSSNSGGEIQVYRVNYAHSKVYDRTVLESFKRIKTIKSFSPVYVMNESMTRDNVLVSGGADKVLSFWNTVTGVEEKRVGGHKTDIVGCVLVENPLKSKDNGYLMTYGNYDDRLMITDINSGETKEMVLDAEVSLMGSKHSNPNMQFMPVTDVFGKSQIFLVSAATRHGSPCIVKILIEQEGEDGVRESE